MARAHCARAAPLVALLLSAAPPASSTSHPRAPRVAPRAPLARFSPARASLSAVRPSAVHVRELDDASVERMSFEGVASMFVDAWFGGQTSSDAQLRQLVDEIGDDLRRRYSFERPADASRLIVAVDDAGVLLGCAGIELLSMTIDGRQPSSWSERLRATLRPHMSNLAVAPSARRLGIASRLVRACERVAVREWACVEQTLFVDTQNDAAMALYAALGYEVVSALRADKPVPRRGQQRRLELGCAFAWVPTTNAFLVKSGLRIDGRDGEPTSDSKR
ncbi:hypothetical protein KFE25_002092 [Diacronema lutheri]|uniref:N-acetyltransferase domain-containing protein n=2 Tax=Diacronema lutheri TaxID=2081491 RepID=A0A8J5XLF7_DIALT|nr:hypothetical protein KFE25_002092 [Diacronema lutheri]